MPYTKQIVLTGDVITADWGNHIQTQYDEVKTELGNNAGDLWTQIKAVDGAGSGLDADLVDSKHLSDLSPAIATGAYTGDGTLGRNIAVGFAPVLVLLMSNYTWSQEAYWIYSPTRGQNPVAYVHGTYMHFLIDHYPAGGPILTSTGFQTGNDGAYAGNKSGTAYRWFAWR